MNILKGVKDKIDVKVVAEVDADQGKTIKVPFTITSRKPNFDERRDAVAKVRDGDMLDEDLVAQYLLGWKGLMGGDNEQIEYNEETLAAVMDAPEYRAALVRGIMTAIVGKEALQKN